MRAHSVGSRMWGQSWIKHWIETWKSILAHKCHLLERDSLTFAKVTLPPTAFFKQSNVFKSLQEIQRSVFHSLNPVTSLAGCCFILLCWGRCRSRFGSSSWIKCRSSDGRRPSQIMMPKSSLRKDLSGPVMLHISRLMTRQVRWCENKQTSTLKQIFEISAAHKTLVTVYLINLAKVEEIFGVHGCNGPARVCTVVSQLCCCCCPACICHQQKWSHCQIWWVSSGRSCHSAIKTLLVLCLVKVIKCSLLGENTQH